MRLPFNVIMEGVSGYLHAWHLINISIIFQIEAKIKLLAIEKIC